MGKSKWNCGCSIPVLALSEAERKEAIHEWAEGNDSLERFLWNCYNNSVITDGCCAGEHHRPYVDFLIEESSRDALKQILDAADNRSNYKAMLFMSGGNPYSGPDWYKPILGISPCKERKSFFNDLNSCSENSKKDEVLSNMINFFEFFSEKIAGIDVLMTAVEHYEYTLEFVCKGDENDFEALSKMFLKAGMSKGQSFGKPMMVWELKCHGTRKFKRKLNNLLNILEAYWCIKTPDETLQTDNFNYKALIMQKKFGTDPSGIKLMNDWINANGYRKDEKVNY